MGASGAEAQGCVTLVTPPLLGHSAGRFNRAQVLLPSPLHAVLNRCLALSQRPVPASDLAPLAPASPLLPPRRSLEVDGKPAALARAGDSADVTLAGVEPNVVGAGSVLCHPDFPVPLVDRWGAGRGRCGVPAAGS